MEFLKVNGVNIEHTEDNVVKAVKNILQDFTSKEAESLKKRIEKAESIMELPDSFFIEGDCMAFISYKPADFMICIDGKKPNTSVKYLREYL